MDAVTLRLLFDAISPILGTIAASLAGEWFRARMARRQAVSLWRMGR